MGNDIVQKCHVLGDGFPRKNNIREARMKLDWFK